MSSPAGFPDRAREALAKLRRPPGPSTSTTEPRFDATSWGGAIVVMAIFGAALWVVQIVNAADHQHLNRFALRPRHVDGLWGIVTQPFLHESYSQLLSNTAPVVLIGWVLLLSGVRVFLFVTVVVIVLGDAATWIIGPGNQWIVGASGMIFGWMGYLLARAYFSRKVKWILTAVALLIFFGALLGSLLPAADTHGAWQSRACGFAAGVFIGWLLHPRGGRNTTGASRQRPAVS